MRPARKLLSDADVVSGGVLAALGAYIFLTAREWPFTTPDGPGPGFFPAFYGVLLIALSLALIVSRLRRATPDEDPADWPGIARALSTWAVFVLVIALIEPLGFVVGVALLAWYLATVVFGKKVTTGLLTGVLCAAGFYAVFVLALGVELPVGLLGI